LSSISFGRALSAGNAPTMPALHCSITRSGLETMNSGAPTTGIDSESRSKAGSAMLEEFLFEKGVSAAAFDRPHVCRTIVDAVEEPLEVRIIAAEAGACGRGFDGKTHLHIGRREARSCEPVALGELALQEGEMRGELRRDQGLVGTLGDDAADRSYDCGQ